jgi:hypothetical protein
MSCSTVKLRSRLHEEDFTLLSVCSYFTLSDVVLKKDETCCNMMHSKLLQCGCDILLLVFDFHVLVS